MTNELSHCQEVINIDYEKGEPLIPKGFYKKVNEIWENGGNEIVINNDHIINVRLHSDSKRFSGCCGNSGSSGPTDVCNCDVEIATESNDCGTVWIITFQENLVELR